jgi:hypothetical protein
LQHLPPIPLRQIQIEDRNRRAAGGSIPDFSNESEGLFAVARYQQIANNLMFLESNPEQFHIARIVFCNEDAWT